MRLRAFEHTRLPSALAIACLLLSAGSAHAFTFRQGDSVEIAAGQTIDDDLYVAASTVRIAGTVTGDLVVACSSLTVSGKVGGDLMAAASQVTLSGEVGGSARVAVSALELSGRVARDLLVAAGNARLDAGSSVGRDAAFAAGDLSLAGRIERALLASGGRASIAGSVGGDARVDSGTLEVADGAVIGGDLRYTARDSQQIAPGARIQGQVIAEEPEKARPLAIAARLLLGWLRLLVGFFLLGLVLVLLMPRLAERTLRNLRRAPGESLGIGAALLLLIPPIAVTIVVIGALIGGWWIGLLLLMAYAIALAFAFPAASLWIGRTVLRRDPTGRRGLVAALALGLVVLLLLMLVPFLGALVAFAALLFGLGALARSAWTRRAELPEPAAKGASGGQPQ